MLGNLAARYESRCEFARAEVLRRLVVQRDSGILQLEALRGNLILQGKWLAVDSLDAQARRRFPTDERLIAWARYRAWMSGNLARNCELLDISVARGDSRDKVQSANRQMLHARQAGRLRDAEAFRDASALREFETARRAAPPASRVGAMLSAARAYASLGMAPQARAALAEYDRSVTECRGDKRDTGRAGHCRRTLGRCGGDGASRGSA